MTTRRKATTGVLPIAPATLTTRNDDGSTAPDTSDFQVPGGSFGFPRIPGFRIRRVIGSGGTGTVYEAEQERPRRIVALKVLRPEYVSPRAVRRFEREIQILAALEHSNIARIDEAGTHRDAFPGAPELPCYAMELIAGGWTIREFARHHDLKTRQRIEMFAKVCDAVYAGHCRGVVHRDLKPENILVNANGEPKVIDFGVSRVLDETRLAGMRSLQPGDGDRAPAESMHTREGQLIGTVRYMSPEQVDTQSIDSGGFSTGLGEMFEGRTDRGAPTDDHVRPCSVGQATRQSRTRAIDHARGGAGRPRGELFRCTTVARMDAGAPCLHDGTGGDDAAHIDDRRLQARPLHGALMKRLAEADISVLAWDLSFVPETPGDVAFVEGVQALQEQGVPVIVVHPSWGIPPDGELRMSPVIAPHVSYAYAAHIDRPRGWEYVPKDGWSHVALAHDRGLHAHRKIPLRVQG